MARSLLQGPTPSSLDKTQGLEATTRETTLQAGREDINRKSLNQFAIRQKITYKILGYALLLPDHSAEHGHFEPVPWQYGDLHTNYPDLTVHDLEAQFVLSILGTNHATLVMDINWIKLGQGQKMQEQSLPTISRGNGGQSP